MLPPARTRSRPHHAPKHEKVSREAQHDDLTDRQADAEGYRHHTRTRRAAMAHHPQRRPDTKLPPVYTAQDLEDREEGARDGHNQEKKQPRGKHGAALNHKQHECSHRVTRDAFFDGAPCQKREESAEARHVVRTDGRSDEGATMVEAAHVDDTSQTAHPDEESVEHAHLEQVAARVCEMLGARRDGDQGHSVEPPALPQVRVGKMNADSKATSCGQCGWVTGHLRNARRPSTPSMTDTVKFLLNRWTDTDCSRTLCASDSPFEFRSALPCLVLVPRVTRLSSKSYRVIGLKKNVVMHYALI